MDVGLPSGGPATGLRSPTARAGLFTGLARTLRTRLFSTPGDAAITLVIGALLLWTVPGFIRWAFLDSVLFTSDASACRAPGAGACWAVVTEKFRYIFLGTYPVEETWRPILVMILLFGLIVASCIRALMGTRLLVLWVATAIATFVLMRGGVPGLPLVDATRWGGLPITLILAVFSLMAAMPVGVLLALGRRSRLPVIRWLSIGYIEFMRGVPLISVLFMASVMLPLFLPDGITVDRVVRALLAFTLFAGAYIAEVIRAGLQAIPKGQFEASASLGLTNVQAYRLVVLPQALRIVIPALVNTFIDFFKDTSLVLIVGLLDLFSTARSVLSDPVWLSFSTELYIFIGLIYFVFCFGMSKYSQHLEGSR